MYTKTNNAIMSEYIRVLESFITPKLEHVEVDRKHSSGEYNFIPLSPYLFLKQLNVVNPLINFSNPSFVDVGCGIGNKLILAALSQLFDKIYGIEISKEYVSVAKRLTSSAECLIVSNALEVDYSNFDVIYFYSPFHSYEMQKRLEERIAMTAKSGAFILANYYKNNKIWEDTATHIWTAEPDATDPNASWINSSIFKKI